MKFISQNIFGQALSRFTLHAFIAMPLVLCSSFSSILFIPLSKNFTQPAGVVIHIFVDIGKGYVVNQRCRAPVVEIVR